MLLGNGGTGGRHNAPSKTSPVTANTSLTPDAPLQVDALAVAPAVAATRTRGGTAPTPPATRAVMLVAATAVTEALPTQDAVGTAIRERVAGAAPQAPQAPWAFLIAPACKDGLADGVVGDRAKTEAWESVFWRVHAMML